MHRHTIWPCHSTPRYLPKTNENMYPYKDLYTNVHSSFISGSQNWKQFKWQLADKQIGIRSCNGILFSNKKEWSIDMFNNLGKSQNNYAEGEKPKQKRLPSVSM